jgi:Na+-translocating ferredoxin:NAD+ oxidoreductase subunit C
MSSFSFKGGIHPKDGKHLSKDKPIERYTPRQVLVPMQQHIGAPAKLVVEEGAQVKKGQLIGESTGLVSAKVHSPVSGKVIKITEATLSIGRKSAAVLIENDGNDQWVECKECNNWESLSKADIITKITDAGIVGMGGATFPTHVKVNPPANKKIDALIINGVECEPYLTADYRLMLEHGKEILEGIRILLHTLEIKKAYIGIEANKPDAVKLFKDLTKGFQDISVHSLKIRYPQGAEKVLIKSILNREVPPGKLPMDVGVVVQNAGTMFSIYEAVCLGRPLVERIVSVTGEGIKSPKNFITVLGTSVAELIEACGGIQGEPGKIISGGPMMGFALHTTDLPVVKGTSGIIALPGNVAGGGEDYSACIKCGRCVGACPMGLQPFMLGIIAEQRMYDRAREYNIDTCFECGSCTYICPSRRPMVQFIKATKMVLKG